MKKQKFLVLYNLIARQQKLPHTLKKLKAFDEGPVFYDVFEFVKNNPYTYLEKAPISKQTYNQEILNVVLTLTESESDNSLSELTHALSLWKKNYNGSSSINNDIVAEDITETDNYILQALFEYGKEIYQNYIIEDIYGKRCAIEKENYDKIKSILESKNYKFEKIIIDLLQIDSMAKIDYDMTRMDDELGGLQIDI